MSRPSTGFRRRQYSPRRHELATRPVPTTAVVWWRGETGDHAFGAGGSGFLRSKCGAVRWSVLMTFVEGTVSPCHACLAIVNPNPVPESIVAPPTESELHLMDGNR